MAKGEKGQVYTLFAKLLDYLRKERYPVGSFSLMETQLGNVRWYRKQAVKVKEREDSWFCHKVESHLTPA